MQTKVASGVGYGAIGGAASAAFSPDLLKAIDPTGAALDPGQQAAMAGFATLLGGGLAGLAGANAQGGATAGQNEVLNNDTASQDHIADAVKNGGLGSAALTLLYTAMPWLPGNPFAQATGQAVTSVVNGVLSQAQANYGRRTPPSDANPLVPENDGNNTPSGTAGAVVTPPIAIPLPNGTIATTPPLIAPGTPIQSSSNSGDDSGSAITGQGSAAGSNDPSTPTGQAGSPMTVKPGTNSPSTIGGVSYSGHASDEMQSDGIVPSAVQNAIQNGTQVTGKNPGTVAYYDATNNITVVTSSSSGKVITVSYGKIRQ